ncbi:hypothetical protein [Pontibacter populi]|uniref:Outer membrane protein beta-barrel domain-containing protein n=1 Tax=Pontibacter populi TaxID=890055 RepID=A0ABV1RXK6_9BACT
MFVGFGENVKKNIFDQNRAYVAIGYKLSLTPHLSSVT